MPGFDWPLIAINAPLTNQGPVTLSLTKKLTKLKEENMAPGMAWDKDEQITKRYSIWCVHNFNMEGNFSWGVDLYLRADQEQKELMGALDKLKLSSEKWRCYFRLRSLKSVIESKETLIIIENKIMVFHDYFTNIEVHYWDLYAAHCPYWLPWRSTISE